MMGLEDVLAEEVRVLGGKKISIGVRSVSYTGDDALLYKSNLHLRTALKILKPIKAFVSRSQDSLYEQVKAMDWSFISVDRTFAVESAVNSRIFKHSKYASLLVKDAIVDSLREKFGKRPNVDITSPDFRIHLHIDNDNVELSLDSSGESLHKRRYRVRQNIAPLNEVLAAGLILTTGWDGKGIFTDPMCGSGTIPIEAAMIAKNIPPGFVRNEFGFMNWDEFNPELWGAIYDDAESKIVNSPDAQIFGSDFSQKSIEISLGNATLAKVDKLINFSTSDIAKYEPPAADSAITVFNPPYGERMSVTDIKNFYKSVGDRLKEAYTNYDVWILSSNKDALKTVGLRTSKRLTFKNGPLEVKFHKYELYKGSKKRKDFS